MRATRPSIMSLGATTSAPGARVHERHLGEDLERRVVVDLQLAVAPLAQDAAVAVVGVLVDADVGHDDELGRGALHLGDRARHGAVGIEARSSRARPSSSAGRRG